MHNKVGRDARAVRQDAHAVRQGTATASPAAASPAAASPAAASHPTPLILHNNTAAKDGINKCPRCGSSEIYLNAASGLLHCNYCHGEWSEAGDALHFDIGSLKGVVMGAGASNIAFDASAFVTLKCSACGAEVIINTKEALQARCHWCRNTLSKNSQVPNGAVPDAIIPFRLSREAAFPLMNSFVQKRWFLANPHFKSQFKPENIMGVYLPYMVVDVNCRAHASGQGERQVRCYAAGNSVLYDAELFDLDRVFDIHIDDMAVEAAASKLDPKAETSSNNVINYIQPYPLKETLKFNANYMRGFTAEKRDLSRIELAYTVDERVNKLVHDKANRELLWLASRTAPDYDRGVRWDTMRIDILGQLWKTVYLPVWIYAYYEITAPGSYFLHYVAVNGATGKTMGSIPIHKPMFRTIKALVYVATFIIFLLVTIPLIAIYG